MQFSVAKRQTGYKEQDFGYMWAYWCVCPTFRTHLFRVKVRCWLRSPHAVFNLRMGEANSWTLVKFEKINRNEEGTVINFNLSTVLRFLTYLVDYTEKMSVTMFFDCPGYMELSWIFQHYWPHKIRAVTTEQAQLRQPVVYPSNSQSIFWFLITMYQRLRLVSHNEFKSFSKYRQSSTHKINYSQNSN